MQQKHGDRIVQKTYLQSCQPAVCKHLPVPFPIFLSRLEKRSPNIFAYEQKEGKGFDAVAKNEISVAGPVAVRGYVR